MRNRILLLAIFVLSGVASAFVLQGSSSFLSATAGVSIPATPYPLPPVTGKAGGPWSCGAQPEFEQLVNGGTVIRNSEQFCAAYLTLFPNQQPTVKIDFDKEFLVIAGGGLLQLESFNISSVERVEASWSSFFGGAATDSFLAVTTTTLIPGVPPPPMTPSTYGISAVRIPRSYLDDVVFHREIIPLP